MLLLGADEGLFAVNISKGQHTLVTKLAGLKNIHHMVYASGLGWVICITGQCTQHKLVSFLQNSGYSDSLL